MGGAGHGSARPGLFIDSPPGRQQVPGHDQRGHDLLHCGGARHLPPQPGVPTVQPGRGGEVVLNQVSVGGTQGLQN